MIFSVSAFVVGIGMLIGGLTYPGLFISGAGLFGFVPDYVKALLRTCFKKQGITPRCSGFVNPLRAVSKGRGWFSQTVELGNQAPTIDLTRFAEYSDNMTLNRG